MAITGKTGADAFLKALKRQSIVWSHLGPKFILLCETLHTSGILLTPEYDVLIAFFNTLPAVLAAMAKVADYSGFTE